MIDDDDDDGDGDGDGDDDDDDDDDGDDDDDDDEEEEEEDGTQFLACRKMSLFGIYQLRSTSNGNQTSVVHL